MQQYGTLSRDTARYISHHATQTPTAYNRKVHASKLSVSRFIMFFKTTKTKPDTMFFKTWNMKNKTRVLKNNQAPYQAGYVVFVKVYERRTWNAWYMPWCT